MKQKFNDYLSEPKRADVGHIGKRILAYLIDHLLVVLAILIIIIPLALIERLYGIPEWLLAFVSILTSLISILYLFFKDAWDGRGIGKRVMGLQVIDFYTGAPVNWKIAALRYLILRLLSLVEVIIIFIQPNHRGVGDWAGHSMVAKRK